MIQPAQLNPASEMCQSAQRKSASEMWRSAQCKPASEMWQLAQVVPPQLLEIIIDHSCSKLNRSSFDWNLVGGLVVGIALVTGGVVVAIVSGGAGTPAMLASITTATGLSGIMYTATTAISGNEFEWSGFATESLVGGATAAGTLGICKAVRGAAGIAQLSKTAFAAAAATANVSVKIARNALEDQDILDGVAATAVGAIAGGLIGLRSVDRYLPSNSEVIRDIGLTIAGGAAIGALSAGAAQATSNLIAGRNLFMNIEDAVKYGVINGAIAASVSTVEVTAGRLVERRYHEALLQDLKADVGNGCPTGALTTTLWCEANNQYVRVIHASNGHVNIYGNPHNGSPPQTVLFTPGDGVNAGHYVRLRNSTLEPVHTMVSGPSTCLADALGVSPQSLAAAYTLKNARAALRDVSPDERSSLSNQDVGGGGKGHMTKREYEAKRGPTTSKTDYHRDMKPRLLALLRNHDKRGPNFLARNKNPDIFVRWEGEHIIITYEGVHGSSRKLVYQGLTKDVLMKTRLTEKDFESLIV